MSLPRDIDWLDPKQPEEKRLVKFERWLSKEMKRHIDWPDDKLRMQCREIMRAQLRVLAERGWLMDSKHLAEFLAKPIREIGQVQKERGIVNLYAYFRAKFCRYVDERAEEIRMHSKRFGYSIQDAVSQLRSIPEIEAERHAESLRDRARKERQKPTTEPTQQTLF